MNQLKRELGTFDATMLGLGSIVGTGIFVSVSIATVSAGAWILWAIALASLVAICNGLSSAQLAANHPVSGGTYEYANRWFGPTTGFVAGWMFLTAKAASAATAALGFSSYVLSVFSGSAPGSAVGTAESVWWAKPGLAYAVLIALTLFTLTGIKRSARLNTALVAITVGSLLLFMACGWADWWFGHLDSADVPGSSNVTSGRGWRGLLEATALMFVAYTGYGRIATLGEEVKSPRTTIPRAIITTLLCAMTLYVGVTAVGVATLGTEAFANASARGVGPLKLAAERFSFSGMTLVIAIGATVALLGVLFNLLLGLSRVALAMGRRGDLPAAFAQVNSSAGVPVPATLLVAGIIAVLIAIGSVQFTWSLSAFTVLVYYGITNGCALRLSPGERLYSTVPAWLGLIACLALAFCVPPRVWMVGCVWIAVGLLYRWGWKKLASASG